MTPINKEELGDLYDLFIKFYLLCLNKNLDPIRVGALFDIEIKKAALTFMVEEGSINVDVSGMMDEVGKK